MAAIRTRPKARAAIIGAILAALPLLGGAVEAGEQPPQGAVVFTDAAGIAGIAGQTGDIAAGAMVFDGDAATLECLDIVEGRDRTHTVYARYATSERDLFWLHIASHEQGSTQAMAGVTRGSTSDEHCGAAGVGAVSTFTMFCGTHGLLRDPA